MKIKTAALILAKFINENTAVHGPKDMWGPGRFNAVMEDCELCGNAGVTPEELDEALKVAGRVAARALQGLF